MTKVEVYECDECGYTSKQDDPNMTVEQEIKQCATCNLDICGQCAEVHCKEETGLVW